MKVLRVTMSDGSKWDVPLQVIVESYLGFYDDITGEDAEAFRVGEAADVQDELKNWAGGDMNWDDVEHRAVVAEAPPWPNHRKGWINGHKEIVEVMDHSMKKDLPSSKSPV